MPRTEKPQACDCKSQKERLLVHFSAGPETGHCKFFQRIRKARGSWPADWLAGREPRGERAKMWPGHNSRTKATFLLGVLSSLYHRKMSAAGKTLVFFFSFLFYSSFFVPVLFWFCSAGSENVRVLVLWGTKRLTIFFDAGVPGEKHEGGQVRAIALKIQITYYCTTQPCTHQPTSAR